VRKKPLNFHLLMREPQKRDRSKQELIVERSVLRSSRGFKGIYGTTQKSVRRAGRRRVKRAKIRNIPKRSPSEAWVERRASAESNWEHDSDLDILKGASTIKGADLGGKEPLIEGGMALFVQRSKAFAVIQ